MQCCFEQIFVVYTCPKLSSYSQQATSVHLQDIITTYTYRDINIQSLYNVEHIYPTIPPNRLFNYDVLAFESSKSCVRMRFHQNWTLVSDTTLWSCTLFIGNISNLLLPSPCLLPFESTCTTFSSPLNTSMEESNGTSDIYCTILTQSFEMLQNEGIVTAVTVFYFLSSLLFLVFPISTCIHSS